MEDELNAMSDIATDAKSTISYQSIYFKAWVGQSYQNKAQEDEYKNNYYSPVVDFADNNDIEAIITCIQDKQCKEAGPGDTYSYAYTVWNEESQKGRINLCDPWFDNDKFPSTSEMKNMCGDTDRAVEEFETPAGTLLHEFLHLGVCEDIQAPFEEEDEVYGGADCAKLAQDDEDQALQNADNWMLVTIGTYWDKICNRRIKLGIPGVDNDPFVSTSGPDPTTAPYEQGTCSLKLTQTTTNIDGQYTLDAQMFDGAGNPIGFDKVVATFDSPLKLMSKLEAIMDLKPSTEHNGMVYFQLGAQMWDTTMNDESDIPYCKRSTDTWTADWSQRQKVYDDCKFICTWGGGKSSDGTN